MRTSPESIDRNRVAARERYRRIAAGTVLGPRLVLVSRLTRLVDRFACVPLQATVSAQTCVARQRKASALPTRRNYVGDRFQACRGCALGQRVARRVR